jgi:hypothetical protein
VRVARRQLRDLRRQYLRDRLRIGGVGDGDHFRDALDLRRLCSDSRGIRGQHDDMHVAAHGLRRAHAFGGGGVEFAAEMFCNDQDLGHLRFLTSFPRKRESR